MNVIPCDKLTLNLIMNSIGNNCIGEFANLDSDNKVFLQEW